MDEPTAEDLARLVKGQPMRRIVDRQCQGCGHEWKQPSPTGRCPKCRSEKVVNLAEKISVYKTV